MLGFIKMLLFKKNEEKVNGYFFLTHSESNQDRQFMYKI